MTSTLPRSSKIGREILYVVVLLLVLCLGAYLVFHNLDEQHIVAYDEARHGVNGYEMLQSGDWIVPTYMGAEEDWNLKPPLSFWLIAINFQLFGYTNFAFRFHSAVAMLLMLLITALWLKKRHGAVASIVAALLMLANASFFGLSSARAGDATMLFVLFYTVSMLCMLDIERDVRWLYGSAVCFGLAFMAKGFHAALIPVTCLVYLLATGRIKQLRLKNYLLVLLIGLLPILPWAIARYLRDGFTFFVNMLEIDVIGRVGAASGNDERAAWYFYLVKLASNAAAVGAAVLCVAAIVCNAMHPRKPTDTQMGLLLWIVLPVVLFSLSAFKLYHYIYPVYAGLAVAAGCAAQALLRDVNNKIVLVAGGVVLAGFLGWQIGRNVQQVATPQEWGTYQEFIAESLDRDVDSGVHMYIQYDSGLSTWSQADVLRAELSGDTLCIHGGIEAFEEDEEDALLILNKEDMPYELLEYYPVYAESQYLYMLQN